MPLEEVSFSSNFVLNTHYTLHPPSSILRGKKAAFAFLAPAQLSKLAAAKKYLADVHASITGQWSCWGQVIGAKQSGYYSILIHFSDHGPINKVD